MAAFLQFEGSKQDDATEQIKRLYALFLKLDATQIEINPFGETPDGQGIRHSFTHPRCPLGGADAYMFYNLFFCRRRRPPQRSA